MQKSVMDRREFGFLKLLRASPSKATRPQVLSSPPVLAYRVYDDVNGRQAAYRPLGTDLACRSLYSSLSACLKSSHTVLI